MIFPLSIIQLCFNTVTFNRNINILKVFASLTEYDLPIGSSHLVVMECYDRLLTLRIQRILIFFIQLIFNSKNMKINFCNIGMFLCNLIIILSFFGYRTELGLPSVIITIVACLTGLGLSENCDNKKYQKAHAIVALTSSAIYMFANAI